MIKATLTPKHARPKKQEIELPDTADTGDIICVISEAIRNSGYKHFNYKRFDGKDWIDREIFEVALEDGRVYHCYEVVINKYRLYEAGFDYDGEYYNWVADFIL